MKLIAYGHFANRDSAAVPVTWSSISGIISSTGWYRAAQEGADTVRAVSQAQPSLADAASFEVVNPLDVAVVRLAPQTATLPIGGSIRFVARAILPDITEIDPEVTWSATGGSITPDGVFTAGMGIGTYEVTAQITGRANTGSAYVTVGPASLDGLLLNPSSVSMATGETRQFAVAASWSDGSSILPPLIWSATGGTVSPSGLYTAGQAAGTFRVIASSTAGDHADTSAVSIAEQTPTALIRLQLTPTTVVLVPGAAAQFAAAGIWADGTTTAPAVAYSSTGGTITPSGLYTAGPATGTFRVIATLQDATKADTSMVSIAAPTAVLLQLMVGPASLTLAPGETGQFTASGTWSDGSTSIPAVAYTATGGTISAAGLYTAGTSAGTFQVVATQQGGTKADTSSVTVTTRPVVSIDVSPRPVSLFPGQSADLAATLRGTDGSELTGRAITWASTNPLIASVSPNGVVTALAPGNSLVTATSEGMTGSAQVTVQATGASTSIYPGDNIQAAVNNFPAGTTFYVKAGIHRMQQVTPRSDDRFVGEPGAILSGARLLTSFSRAGTYWVAAGQSQEGRVAGTCLVSRPRCERPEDLFFDDVPLIHVPSLGEVGPGRWYFDYAADKIFLASDPAGHKVEASVSSYAFGGAIRDVTITGLVIEKYANPAQQGAIQGDRSARWIVTDNEVRLNHGTGILIGTGMQMTGNRVHHQGQLGIGGGGENILMENNELSYNNTAGFSWYWEAGGTKFSFTTDLIVRGNFSHHNTGPGLWTDINNIHTLYDGNRVEDNDGPGIFHEISYAAVIRNNTVSRNGWGSKNYAVWPEGSGILVNSSSDVQVFGNTLTDNANGIGAIQSQRGNGLYGAYLIQNLDVHDNQITQRAGMSGVVQNAGDDAVFTVRNNRFRHNTYYLGSNAAPFRWNNGPRTTAEWRATGNDADGVFLP